VSTKVTVDACCEATSSTDDESDASCSPSGNSKPQTPELRGRQQSQVSTVNKMLLEMLQRLLADILSIVEKVLITVVS